MTANQNFENEPYRIHPENPSLIVVCSCCFPGKTILDLFPDLSGATISHGICPGHDAIYRNELAELRKNVLR